MATSVLENIKTISNGVDADAGQVQAQVQVQDPYTPIEQSNGDLVGS